MTIDEALPWQKEHREGLLESIRNGKYKPSPVRRVEIPKDNGGVRKLGTGHNVAYMTVNRRITYWFMANTHVMKAALSDKRMEKAGFVSFWSYCKSGCA